jgi:hypothetical protein
MAAGRDVDRARRTQDQRVLVDTRSDDADLYRQR